MHRVIYSQNFYQNQRVLRRSIYIQPVLTSREECNVYPDLLFQNLFQRFCHSACFFAARFTLRQPKTPVWNATNLWTFCFEDYHYAFQETLCPVTLAHQIFLFYSSLYFYTFLYIPPHSCPFHTFYFTPISYVYYHAKHFSYP